MAPKFAAERFRAQHPDAAHFEVTLCESLAATGRGHLTDVAVLSAFAPVPATIIWAPEQRLPLHPNGMIFRALDEAGQARATWTVYSIGGGALMEADGSCPLTHLYPEHSLSAIMDLCVAKGLSYWEYVAWREGDGVWDFLRTIWVAMQESIERGLSTEGVLPGFLGLPRRAWAVHQKAMLGGEDLRQTGLLSAYALAVSEENASGGVVVTAPTCGASGVMPAVLRYLQERLKLREPAMVRALATGGLIGLLIKTNASISGAEVGCQGEVGSACAMAAAAATQLMGGSVRQIEYAAEMGLEHHLGLTCDPVGGLVQIPCIERNACAATRAVSIAHMAMLSDGTHAIPFDEVVRVMRETGHDLPSLYRETAYGGLAKAYGERLEKKEAHNDL